MPIANFDPQALSNDFAQQAQQVIPKDLTEEQQKYVVNKVYQFCILAGQALDQDTNLNLNVSQAVVISQFIGEWTFHKAVDVIRSGIPAECWDQVLQEVAFAVFETAKRTQASNMPQDQSIAAVEKEVIAAYEKSLRDLSASGKIKQDNLSQIMSQSNIDKMAKEGQGSPPSNREDEEKMLKYASIALLLKSLSDLKREKILSSMGKQEVEQIRAMMKIPNLEQKVNPALISKFLNDFKSNIPSIKRYVYSQSNNIMSLKERYTELEIKKVVQSERKKIRDYVDYSLLDIPTAYKSIDLSEHINKIIADYIRTKLPV